MIIEVEISKPLQKKLGFYRSNATKFRVWWLWFAIAVYRENARERSMRTWED